MLNNSDPSIVCRLSVGVVATTWLLFFSFADFFKFQLLEVFRFCIHRWCVELGWASKHRTTFRFRAVMNQLQVQRWCNRCASVVRHCMFNVNGVITFFEGEGFVSLTPPCSETSTNCTLSLPSKLRLPGCATK